MPKLKPETAIERLKKGKKLVLKDGSELIVDDRISLGVWFIDTEGHHVFRFDNTLLALLKAGATVETTTAKEKKKAAAALEEDVH